MTYLKDLHAFIESIPFGTVNIQVQRANKKTVKIITDGKETLRYVDNDEAIRDLTNMITMLIDSSYTGTANVELVLKDGQITLLGLYEQKETNYQG